MNSPHRVSSRLLDRTPHIAALAVAALAIAALATVTLLVPAPVQAQPQHDCERPEKPESFESKEEQDEFVEAAQSYMDCLLEFYNEQAEASRLAAEAANAAKDEMEEFAESVNN